MKLKFMQRFGKHNQGAPDDDLPEIIDSKGNSDKNRTNPEPKSQQPDTDITLTDEGVVSFETIIDPQATSGTDTATSIKVIKKRMETAREHFSSKKYNPAMDEIMAVLDVYPKNKEAMELAQTILYLCSSIHSPEKISPSISEDPLLDGLYNQCHRCFRCWPGNPIYKDFSGLFVTNPVGGRCPHCTKVWCRECADSGMFLFCPDCKEQLEVLREPSGRKRGLHPAKHPDLKLLLVFIFKAPPKPRNPSSYISIVLDALCPEAFHSTPRINFNIGEQGTDQQAAMIYAFVYAQKLGIDIDHENTFIEPFSDAEGGKGIMITLYEP